MVVHTLITFAIILGVIPGACCYDYGYGGLVASSIISFFMLAMVFVMLIVSLMWNDWYRKRQAMRGIPKGPRTAWSFFESKPRPTLVSTPRSENTMRQHNMQYVIPAPGSKNTTLTRNMQADAWVTQLPPPTQFEEKGKTIEFAAEDEPRIETEIIQNESQPRVINLSKTLPNPSTTPFSNTGNTTYVALTGSRNEPHSTNREPERQETIKPTPYHVHLGTLPDSSSSTRQPVGLSATYNASEPTGKMDFYEEDNAPATNTGGEADVVLF